MPDLSIVITSYNTRELLRRCLRSIQETKGDLTVEIVVVDNVSKDESAAMVRETAPDAKLIEPGYNTFATGGNNLGIANSTGDYILLLNPDTVILPNTLQTCIAYLRSNKEVGAVSCKSYFPAEPHELQYTCSRFPTYSDLLFDYTFLGVLFTSLRKFRRAAMWYSDWHRDTDREVDVIPGSFMMLPAALLKQIEGYDKVIKLYYVEDDLCQRVIRLGYKVMFLANAVFLHEERASTSQVLRLSSAIYFDDLIIFTCKYYGNARAILLKMLVIPTRWAMDTVQRLRGERKNL